MPKTKWKYFKSVLDRGTIRKIRLMAKNSENWHLKYQQLTEKTAILIFAKQLGLKYHKLN